MCTVSNIGDQWSQSIPQQYPWTQTIAITNPPTRAEFDALKRDVAQMREELRAAKAQDIADGNPDCEMEDKVALLKRVAELVGVDLSEVFG